MFCSMIDKTSLLNSGYCACDFTSTTPVFQCFAKGWGTMFSMNEVIYYQCMSRNDLHDAGSVII